MRALLLLIVGGALAHAQLIPAGQPVPRRAGPPVVFVNGYRLSCPATFADTFGVGDQVMTAAGRVSLWFDNCVYPNRPLIEELGDRFGEFLNALRYEDGTPVASVDVVAHSMGGLIVRSYLSGKRTEPGIFTPPAAHRINKIVFLSTPHFGTAAAVFAGNRQGDQLLVGSRFLIDLATWNQGIEELRGVSALSLTGDAGAGANNPAKTDDSVTALTSGSIDFIVPGFTRVLPYCHITGGLVILLGLCPPNTLGIADITGEAHLSARAIVSFLRGTTDWQSVGQTPAQNSVLAANAGLTVIRSNGTQLEAIESATVAVGGAAAQTLTLRAQSVAYREFVSPGSARIVARSGGVDRQKTVNLGAGLGSVVNLTDVPVVVPAPFRPFPVTMAPGSFVSIYGVNLAPRIEGAAALPLPAKLADTEVLVDGAPIPLHYASPGQINAVLPEAVSGRVRVVVRRAGAADQVFFAWTIAATPAIFTVNSQGTGLASATNAVTGEVITAANAIARGDFLALYLTGLGATVRREGLDWSVAVPSVTVGGKTCEVTYAGRAPGYAGLDQLNCRIAPDAETGPSAVVRVTVNDRVSNSVTLPVR